MESVINRQSLTRRSSSGLYGRGRMSSLENSGTFLTRVREAGTRRIPLNPPVTFRSTRSTPTVPPKAGLLSRLEQSRTSRSRNSLLRRVRRQQLQSDAAQTVPFRVTSRTAGVSALNVVVIPLYSAFNTVYRAVYGLTAEILQLPQRILVTDDGELAPIDQGFIAAGMLFVVASLAILSTPVVQDVMRYDPFPASISLDHSRLADPLERSESQRSGFHLDGPEVELDVSRFQRLTFQEHTVAPGETISGIAARYGITMDTLVSFNQISDSRRVQVGSRFQIPSRSGLRHIVRTGESLGSIAASYGAEVSAILDANDLVTDTVTVGQELFIPEARMRNTELRLILGELFIMPTTGRVTSGFGYRPDPFTGRRSFHNGIDWAGPRGTPIVASMAGRVVESGVHSIYGNYVVIQHPEGFQSLYAHMERVTVNRGQTVNQRQQIGSMGSTGRSTGSHLHFSLFRNGQAVDPLRHIHR